MSSNNIYVVAFLFALTVFFLSTPCISEAFINVGKKPINGSLEEYAKDIRYFASYVGYYIGGVYADKRARLFNNASGFGVGNGWSPRGDLANVDPNLLRNDDNILSTARFQLKTYLDSMLKYLNEKYPIELVKNPNFNLDYVQNPSNGVLKIRYVENGKESSYLV